MKSYADRWASLRDGYLHPGELEIDPSLHLHTDVAELDAASAQISVVGERYPEAMQRMIDR